MMKKASKEKLQELFSQIEKKKAFSGAEFNNLSPEEKQRMVNEGLKSMGKVSGLKHEPEVENPEGRTDKKKGGKGFFKSFLGNKL
ncbi:hypothetical protein ACFL5V_01315 [Fibrobacterota bacterium]